MRSHWDYTIEVCIVCGCQLSRGDTRAGRCIDPEHGRHGGMVVRVAPRPLAEQDERSTQGHWSVLDPEKLGHPERFGR